MIQKFLENSCIDWTWLVWCRCVALPTLRAAVVARLAEYRAEIRSEQNSDEAFGRLQAVFDHLKARVEAKKAKLARLEAVARNVHARATYAADVIYLHHQALDSNEAEVSVVAASMPMLGVAC